MLYLKLPKLMTYVSILFILLGPGSDLMLYLKLPKLMTYVSILFLVIGSDCPS
jgi:hypothetical protein